MQKYFRKTKEEHSQKSASGHNRWSLFSPIRPMKEVFLYFLLIKLVSCTPYMSGVTVCLGPQLVLALWFTSRQSHGEYSFLKLSLITFCMPRCTIFSTTNQLGSALIFQLFFFIGLSVKKC